MRSYKVFISGRVTGLPWEEAVKNFERGKKMLLQNTYDPVSPLDHVKEGATPKEAMKICYDLLFPCDGILLLNDHKFSEGSNLEEKTARYCGLMIFYEDDLI